MAGLLGEDYEDPATQGLLSAGLSMLAASGPSTKRTSVGQVLGLGGLQGMQAYQQAQKMALLKAEEERRKQEAAAMEEYRRMQIEQMRAAMDDKKRVEGFLSNPANFMQMTPPQSAVGDYGPGEAPTVGPNTTGMRPKPMADIATAMIMSGHPALAQAGLSTLAKQKGELMTVGNAIYDSGTDTWKVPPHEQKPGTESEVERMASTLFGKGTPEYFAYLKKYLTYKAEKETTPNFTFIPTADGIVAADTRRGVVGPQPVAQPPARPDRALPTSAVNDLTGKRQEAENISRVLNTFKNEYGGSTSDFVGEAKNFASRKLPGFSDDRGKWWQDMQAVENTIRHGLFGSALTKTERDAWDKTSVTPGMKPDVISANLARRKEIADSALKRMARTYAAAGYSAQMIEEATGISIADVAPEKKRGGAGGSWGGPATDRLPTPEEIDAELNRRLNGGR